MVYDLQVLGAGPTGSYCANALSRKGYSVLLVDKADFPRDKLCGGGLTRKSLELLRALEPGFDNSGLAEYVHSFSLIHPDSFDQVRVRIPENWVALVKRWEFDQWLLERALDAGCDYSKTPGESRFTIAADGATSEFGRQIRGPLRNFEVAVATETTAVNADGPHVSLLLNRSRDPSELGYSWFFARSHEAMVGTGVVRSHDASLPGHRRNLLRAAEMIHGQQLTGFRNWIIPLYRPRAASRGNIALVGDALGTADPLFVEGIASGLINARILVDHFGARGDFTGYETAIASDPYFQSMPGLWELQRRGNADYELTYRLLAKPKMLERFIRLLIGEVTPQELARHLWQRYPLTAARFFLATQLRSPRSDPWHRLSIEPASPEA